MRIAGGDEEMAGRLASLWMLSRRDASRPSLMRPKEEGMRSINAQVAAAFRRATAGSHHQLRVSS